MCYPSMQCRWYPSLPCRSPGGVCYPSMHCRWYPSMPCSRSLGGGLLWGDLILGGVAFCYGLLWSSVMAFWFGGLLIEGSLPVWSSWGGKATTPEGHHTRGHHTRRPEQKGVPGGDPPQDSYCCRQYASYWNAFLFT